MKLNLSNYKPHILISLCNSLRVDEHLPKMKHSFRKGAGQTAPPIASGDLKKRFDIAAKSMEK
jgi:hypothetical protein